MKKTLPFRKTKMVSTPDKSDFLVIESDGVQVTLSKQRKKGSPYCVSVWGDDDIGMEIYVNDVDRAYKIFNSIKDGITMKALKAKGFVQG